MPTIRSMLKSLGKCKNCHDAGELATRESVEVETKRLNSWFVANRLLLCLLGAYLQSLLIACYDIVIELSPVYIVLRQITILFHSSEHIRRLEQW